MRLRFGLCGDRFWPESDFGRFVSGPRNPVSPMHEEDATVRERVGATDAMPKRKRAILSGYGRHV